VPADIVPGGYLTCYADGVYEIIDANQYVIDLVECDGLEDLKDFSAHTVPRLLKEPSNSSMRESTWMKRGMRGGVMHADFRVPTKSGKTIAIDTFARLMRREGERPILHMFLVELERGGTIDSLTGLYGFEEFVYAANEEAERLFALGERPTLIVLDLMGMKTFNANYGFEAGDAALIALADVLRRHFKADFCCRFAGDGFCVICDSKVVEHELSCAFA
jgi:GGDEF domain-containing protein